MEHRSGDVVQAYGREASEEERFRNRVEQSLGLTLEASSLQLQLPRLVRFIFAAATALQVEFEKERKSNLQIAGVGIYFITLDAKEKEAESISNKLANKPDTLLVIGHLIPMR